MGNPWTSHQKARKRAKKRQAWEQRSDDIQTVGTGVATAATVFGGLMAAAGWYANRKSETPHQVDRRQQLLALSLDAQKQRDRAINRHQRKVARDAQSLAEKALHSLSLDMATAEADYARAVYAGVQMHRTAPTEVPQWWPEGVK